MFKRLHKAFDSFAGGSVRLMGSATAFVLAVTIVLFWGVTGPVFGFSDTWQLIINTSTTIITFLMVFLLQHSQNKDSRAIHTKLDDLIEVTAGANDKLIDLEDLTDDEIERARAHYRALARATRRNSSGRRPQKQTCRRRGGLQHSRAEAGAASSQAFDVTATAARCLLLALVHDGERHALPCRRRR